MGTALVIGLAAFIGSRLLRLKDSAEKIIFTFVQARLKGGKLKTAIVAGTLNLELVFDVTNPGKARIAMDYMMLDASLKFKDGSEAPIASIRVEKMDDIRKQNNNPNLYVFEPQKTSQIVIPIKIPLTSVSHLGLIAKVISGNLPVAAIVKGYISANGIRIEMNETKPFGKTEAPAPPKPAAKQLPAPKPSFNQDNFEMK